MHLVDLEPQPSNQLLWEKVPDELWLIGFKTQNYVGKDRDIKS